MYVSCGANVAAATQGGGGTWIGYGSYLRAGRPLHHLSRMMTRAVGVGGGGARATSVVRPAMCEQVPSGFASLSQKGFVEIDHRMCDDTRLDLHSIRLSQYPLSALGIHLTVSIDIDWIVGFGLGIRNNPRAQPFSYLHAAPAVPPLAFLGRHDTKPRLATFTAPHHLLLLGPVDR